MAAPMYQVTVPPVEIRPIELFQSLVNHNAPSGPLVMASGSAIPGPVKMVTFPAVVILPIAPPLPRYGGLSSVNHNAPSGPAVMLCGGCGPNTGKASTLPVAVISPIDHVCLLTNHTEPAGPAVSPTGEFQSCWENAIGPLKFFSVPPVAIRPIELLALLVNHSRPSGPSTIPKGPATSSH